MHLFTAKYDVGKYEKRYITASLTCTKRRRKEGRKEKKGREGKGREESYCGMILKFTKRFSSVVEI